MLRWKSLLPTRLPKGTRRRGRRGPLSGLSSSAAFSRRLAAEQLEDRRMLAGVTVSNINDLVNGDVTSIANLIGDDGGDGISLREAVQAANTDAGDPSDTVTFEAALSGLEINLTGTEIEVTDDLIIDATSLPAGITIDAQNLSRIFNFSAGTGNFTLVGLTLTRGRTTGDNEDGGAVRSESTGLLTIDESLITGSSTTGENSDGGAVYTYGSVTITNSTISGNGTTGDFSDGGGVYAYGDVTLMNSTVSGNSTMGNNAEGGGIYAYDDVFLTDSTVSGNRTMGPNSEGGGICAYDDVTVTSSTVSGNSTTGDNSHGGGIYSYDGIVTLTNSTVSGNRTTGPNSDGGGVYANRSLTANMSTVTDNHADANDSQGGGLWIGNNTDLRNTIVAANTAGGGNPDLRLGAGALNIDFSLIGTNAGTVLVESQTPDADGNLIGGNVGGVIDPRLGPLEDNGGPTLTHQLLPGSPALNAGDPAVPAFNNEFDQRGTPFFRVRLGRLDIGAFEAQIFLDAGAEVATWAAGTVLVDINGDFIFNPVDPDPMMRDVAYRIGFGSDYIFAGNFAGPGPDGDFGTPDDTAGPLGNAIASNFDKVAAYGRVGGVYRWLFDIDHNGSADFNIADPAGINGFPIAGNFDGNTLNGDEVGLFDGRFWYFDTNHDFQVDTTFTASYLGFPIAGDFDGDGDDDVATYLASNGGNIFHVDLNTAAAGAPIVVNGVADFSFRMGSFAGGDIGFAGTRERPVAADFNEDGIDDIGLWVPDGIVPVPNELAEWYILISGDDPLTAVVETSVLDRIVGGPLNGFVPFSPAPFGNDLYILFGNTFALPLAGNFPFFSPPEPPPPPPPVIEIEAGLGQESSGPDVPTQIAATGTDESESRRAERQKARAEAQVVDTQTALATVAVAPEIVEPPALLPDPTPIEPATDAADRRTRKRAEREDEHAEEPPVVSVPAVESVAIAATLPESKSAEVEPVVKASVTFGREPTPVAPIVEAVADAVAARVEPPADKQSETSAPAIEKARSESRSRIRSLNYGKSAVEVKSVIQVVVPTIAQPVETQPVIQSAATLTATVDTVEAGKDLQATKVAAVDAAHAEIAPVVIAQKSPEIVREAALAQAAAWQNAAAKTQEDVFSSRRFRRLILR